METLHASISFKSYLLETGMEVTLLLILSMTVWAYVIMIQFFA